MNTVNTKRACEMNVANTLPAVLLLFAGLVLSGCNSTTVKTTAHEQVITANDSLPEDLILDVGIGIFNPGVDSLSAREEGVYPQIRKAEARYMPRLMQQTLQQTGNWGAVRVIPERLSEMDVWVDAEILRSDGENLWLQVQVQDASGRVWFNRKYTEQASKFSYDTAIGGRVEPFQGLYNKVANDMLQYRRQLSFNELQTIRTVAELKFAKAFTPALYNGHLQADKRGRYSITRLPAAGDPVFARLRQIRERDHIFVDTLQQYYDSFYRQMEVPYREWREAFYIENAALKEVRSQANARLIGGLLAVAAGILAQGSGSRTARSAGAVGIGAGALAVQSGLGKRQEAKIHVEALAEISDSLNAEIEPHTVTLEDRTVTLTGTVKEQYQQWRQLLKAIYHSETGLASTPPDQR